MQSMHAVEACKQPVATMDTEQAMETKKAGIVSKSRDDPGGILSQSQKGL